MPDTKVRLPNWLMMDSEQKEDVKKQVAQLVARNMTCFGYDDKTLVQVTPDQIDVELIWYDPEDVQFGAIIVVEICAYDYPSRMSNMDQRLTPIGVGIKQLDILGRYDALVRGQQTVSLSYIPIPDKCWVAVD